MRYLPLIAAMLLSPGLALAGWRMGLRRRGEGEDVVTPGWVATRRNPLASGNIRPRVRKAVYERQKRGA